MHRRVLLIPQVGLSRLQSDSSYMLMIDLINASREMGHGEFFYLMVPEWAEDALPDQPNMLTVKAPMNRDFWVNEMQGVPLDTLAELFARRGGRYMVDAVYSEIIRASWVMGQTISDYRSLASIPVFISDPIGIDDWCKRTEEQRFYNVISYFSAYQFANSNDEYEAYAEDARAVFKPAVVDRLMKRVHRVPYGVDIDFYERIRKEEVPNKHPTVSLFCGMRFNENKNITFVMDLFRTLYGAGRDIHVCSTTGTDKIKGMQQIPDRDLSMLKTMKWGCPREEYMREAARCHIFLSASKHETFAAHIVEQLALGLVGIVPNDPWVWRWIPREYPFAYDPGNKEEAYTLVSWVMDNYERALELARPFQEKVCELYRSGNASRAVLDAFAKRIDERFIDYSLKKTRFLRKGKFRVPFRFELCDVADSLGESFTMTQLLAGLKKRMPKMDMGVYTRLGGPRLGVPTLYDMRMILESFGWSDTCDGPEVRFVRTPNVRVPSKIYAERIAAAKKGKPKEEDQAPDDGADEEDDDGSQGSVLD